VGERSATSRSRGRHATPLLLKARGSDQAIGLRQRDARRGMVSPPVPGPDALRSADRGDAQPIEEAYGSSPLGVAQTPMDLLDTDRRREWHVTMVAKRCESLDGAGPASQHIDQHRRVQQDAHS
jgi:hypothetical protein